ncbi:MAG: hypothetical protein LBR62_00800, partial [Puniceicoccales bacterium]|nr:hypothetical protein [Puniceicoccales bacterium]
VPEIKEAKAVYERSKSDPIAQERIRIHEKAIIDRAAAISTAKDEGRKEEKIAIAKSMLKDGADLSIIVKYTGLTERQIQELE